MQNFGQRLKALVARRSLKPEQVWKKLGVSRATYFNWLKRQDPPPSSQHQKDLVAFFGMSESYVLHGQPKNLDESKIESTSVSDLDQAAYGSSEMLEVEIRHLVSELITAAKSDPKRLGWIIEQLKEHLAVPKNWRTNEELNRLAYEQVARARAEREREAPHEHRDHQRAAKSA